MTQKPSLLFLAPVMPAPTGNGLAMRAGLILDALARNFSVHLLVVPLFGAERISRFAKERAARTMVAHLDPRDDALRLAASDPKRAMALLMAQPQPVLCRFATRALLGRLAAHFAGVRFDVIHVMRLYMAPYAAPFLEAGARQPAAVLDLDDDEVRTRARLGSLYAQTGQPTAARLEALEADRYQQLERVWVPRFDRVLVCSETDRARLSSRIRPAKLGVVPNAVPVPAAAAGAAVAADARTLLFVGTLGYFPNQDGATLLCREVLPIIRERAGGRGPVRVTIVGRNPSPEIRALSRLPAVKVEADVPDLDPWYRDASVVVLPLRAGGGTRFKLLEALARAKPVVSTSIGAEGVAVEHRRHLMLADRPEVFAAACLELLSEPGLARGLGEQGRALVRARYAPESAAADLVRAYSGLYARAQVVKEARR